MRPVVLLLAAMPVVASGACAQADRNADTDRASGERVVVEGGAYTNIDVAELQGMLADKDFPLVNVHIPFEGDLPGTDVSIPFHEITSRLDELPADRNATIVMYCKSGRMSAEASAALASSVTATCTISAVASTRGVRRGCRCRGSQAELLEPRRVPGRTLASAEPDRLSTHLHQEAAEVLVTHPPAA